MRMRFREINEIKHDETKKNRNEKEEEFKKIKPERMTYDEATSFWNNLFNVTID